MSGVWYWSALTCCHCGSTVVGSATELSTARLSPDFAITSLDTGELLDVDLEDLLDAFPPATRRPSGGPLRVLEHWTCPVCGTDQAVVLSFADERPAGFRLLGAEAWWVTAELLGGVDGVSTTLRETLDGRQLEVLEGNGREG